jgi:cytochrome c551/c552
MKSQICILTLVSLVFFSCKKEEIVDPDPQPTPQVISYNSIKSIVQDHCLNCHAQNQNAYIPSFETYDLISSYLESPNNSMIDRLNSNEDNYKMPPSSDLSEADKSSLITWINEGFIE